MLRLKNDCAAIVMAVALSVPVSAQSTWIVDVVGGPGVDFTNIQDAIVASSDGDLILVNPGSYLGFTLRKSVRIVGRSTVETTTRSHVLAVNGQLPACIANLRMVELDIEACASTIVVANCSELRRVTVDTCADVRFARSHLIAWTQVIQPAEGWTLVRNSRAEFSDCTIDGTVALWDATDALEVHDSRVHLATTLVTAFDGLEPCPGGSCFSCGYAGGNGGTGVRSTNSEVVLTGNGTTQVRGGLGAYSPCFWGLDGSSLNATGGSVRHSGMRFNPAPIQASGTFIETPAQDPVLSLVGVATPGASLEVVLRGTPGENAAIFLGRSAVVLPRPGSAIERLTSQGRTVNVSPLPASGEARVPITIPTAWPSGTLVYFQGVMSDGPGQVQYSNSVPLVVL